MAREYTNKLVEKISEGILDPDYVLTCCLQWMSEAEVKDMCLNGDLADEFDEDEAEDEAEEFDMFGINFFGDDK